MDIEHGLNHVNNGSHDRHAKTSSNSTVSWANITVTVKDRSTKLPLQILDGVNGLVEAGEMLALMGPSGSGKTTLLNVLANRKAAGKCETQGGLLLDGQRISFSTLRSISTYVEQEDALIGSLTVLETMDFSAQLSAALDMPSKTRKLSCLELLQSFGLEAQAHSRVGTPIFKGLSGGQKRRLSVASQLVTRPKILFLDEPTSGLDSVAAYEVMSKISKIAKRDNMIVIASIHQPSVSTFNLFSKVMLLSRGKTVYFGRVDELDPYLESINYPVPHRSSTAEHILQLSNVDFAETPELGQQQITALHNSWETSSLAGQLQSGIEKLSSTVDVSSASSSTNVTKSMVQNQGVLKQTSILLHRLFLKSYRDTVAYQIRIAMYLGLAIMMGTVWLRLGSDQHYIQSYVNALFFSGAFMSFMAVAYIPAYLEDFAAYKKEKDNGLYGPTAFILSNFIIGIPFLYLISMLFSIVAYWLVNFNPTAHGFFMFSTWLFVDLLAAESLVVLVSSIIPIFVGALAIVAFSNGLWMSVGGFLVPQNVLNKFWYYTFYWIDYQRYVFQGMMFNEFKSRVFGCGIGCHCMYKSALESQCKIAGVAVLEAVGYTKEHTGLWFGLTIAIVVGMRLISWMFLLYKNK